MSNILYLLLCIIPSILLLLYVYENDKIEKEPPYLLLILFIEGIISGVFSITISKIFNIYITFMNYNNLKLNIYQITSKFIIIALIEECTKWIINYYTIWRNKNFNHIYDPIIYSTTVSLGFATIENIIYGIMFSSNGIIPIILRGIISVPCHAVFGIFMGYYLGIAKKYTHYNNRKNSKNYKLLSIFIPIILHFIYDILLVKQTIIINIIFIIYITIIYFYSYKKIKMFSSVKTNIN